MKKETTPPPVTMPATPLEQAAKSAAVAISIIAKQYADTLALYTTAVARAAGYANPKDAAAVMVKEIDPRNLPNAAALEKALLIIAKRGMLRTRLGEIQNELLHIDAELSAL